MVIMGLPPSCLVLLTHISYGELSIAFLKHAMIYVDVDQHCRPEIEKAWKLDSTGKDNHTSTGMKGISKRIANSIDYSHNK